MSAFIIAEHGSTAARIRDILSFGGRDCPSANVLGIDGAASRLEREKTVDLVIVSLSAEPDRGIGLLPSLRKLAGRKVLAVGPTGDARLVLRALREGAGDYVDANDLEVELEPAVKRLERDPNGAGRAEAGRTIGVVGAGGGVGASTLAVNLASAIARAPRPPAALVDLKLDAGDLSAMLDLKPAYTLADLCQNASRLDRTMFERSLAVHPSGVRLIAAPNHLADLARVRPDGLAQILDLAGESFPRVVLDLPPPHYDSFKPIYRRVDLLVVAFRLDFASLRTARRVVEGLDGLELPADKVVLVVNRSGQPQEVPAAKAEEALGRKVAHHVVDDPKAANRAINNGVPAVLDDPKSALARSLIRLADAISPPADAARPARAGGLARLFAR